MNISAEEKSALMRDAMSVRDDELREIEKATQAEEEAAEAAKDKLDWQKEYVDAQMEQLNIMARMQTAAEKVADALSEVGGALGGEGGGLTLEDGEGLSLPSGGGLGDPTKEAEDLMNVMKLRMGSAMTAFNEFRNGVMGLGFGGGMSADDQMMWQGNDPEGYEEAKKMYDMGAGLREPYEKIKGAIEDIQAITSGDWLGIAKIDTEKLGEIKEDFLTLENAIEGIGASLGTINIGPAIESFGRLYDSVGKLLTTFAPGTTPSGAISGVLGYFGLIAVGIVAGVVNSLGEIVSGLANLVSISISRSADMFDGIGRTFSGIFETIQGVLEGDWERFKQGVMTMYEGAVDTVFAIALGLIETGFEIFDTGVDSLLAGLEPLAVGLAKAAFGEDMAKAVEAWFDNLRGFLNKGFSKVEIWFEEKKQKALEMVNALLNIIGKISGLQTGGITTNYIPNTGSKTQSSSQMNWSRNDDFYGLAYGRYRNGAHQGHSLGKGNEPEAVLPLSRLPGLFEQMYGGNQMAFAGAGDTININIGNIRDDRDIKKIADEVEKVMNRKASSQMRFRRG